MKEKNAVTPKEIPNSNDNNEKSQRDVEQRSNPEFKNLAAVEEGKAEVMRMPNSTHSSQVEGSL